MKRGERGGVSKKDGPFLGAARIENGKKKKLRQGTGGKAIK